MTNVPASALYGIFFVSGCAGLVYEVMWTRSFGLVFGSTTRAAAIVLAGFFLGMAVGNWLGSRLDTGARRAALRRYAWLELAVAAAALLVLGWLRLYHGVYPALYRATFDSPAALSALQLALAALALGPPCIAMGATLPLMSRAVVASEERLGRRLGLVYALNTLGGVVGVILSGFWLPVALGVRGSMGLAALLNGIAAAAAFVVARRLSDGPPAAASAAPRIPPPAQGTGFGRLAATAAVSGLGTLALEVLFTRLLVNAMDSSVFSFALVLATFLVSLALGSALVSLVVDRISSPWLLVAAGSGLGSVAILLAPALCTRLWWTSLGLPPTSGALGAAAVLLPVTFAVMGPPALLIGMVLPATWRAAIARPEETGAAVGRLTSLNTLAAVAGSLAAGFVLIPRLGTGSSLLLVACLYAVLGAFALLAAPRPRRAAALLALLAFAGLASLRTWQVVPALLGTGDRLVALDEGEGATVAVTESTNGERQLVVNSRYTLGSNHSGPVHRSQGELALALHGAPREVAFIGVATGMSVSSILSHPSIERVVAIELLPGVTRLARLFRAENEGVLEDPRVELQLADGRNHLFGTDRRFDAIVGDLFVPWHAGTGYLYTVEHFRNVRERLAEGGVFVQWLQVDQATLAETRSLAASFTAAFDDAELWLNTLGRARPLLGFVGFRGRTPRAAPFEPGPELERVCGGEVLRAWSAGAPLNTDDVPFIEFSAAASHVSDLPRSSRAVLGALAELRAAEQRRGGAP